MKSDEKLDLLLKHALSPNEEPGDRVNQSILQKAREMESMKKGNRKRISAVVLVAVFVLAIGSVTAAAALKYMAPDKIAEEMDDRGLAEAFQGKDAIAVNETQKCGSYMITLLGVVSGESLSDYMAENDGEIEADKTYVVTAIENADKTPQSETDGGAYGEESFFVSPLIKGCNPAEYNIVTMNGGYCEFVQDGIRYRIAECDNVEIFADRGLYLCVNDGVFYNPEAYNYGETTGEITRNENYEGVNALFTLPLDKSRADRDAAEAYIQNLFAQERESDEGEMTDSGKTAAEELDEFAVLAEEIEDWSEEELEKKAALLEDITQTLTPDEDGYFSYQYKWKELERSMTQSVDDIFEEGQTGMGALKYITGSDDAIYIDTYTRNGDGTITLKVYEYYK